MLYKLLSNMQQ